jgi:chaperonin GroEL|tara:strand:- start:1430 stop:2929 length:1500 start_codon:yes stop_codon:yes gene_type:complete
MILHGKEVKQKLLEGINLVADTVSPTLGPQARTVILQGEPPVIINDGVTITKYVRSDDPYVQMGIQMVQNLASKAQDSSGDGTTTACVIARALCEEISNLDDFNIHQLRLELELAQRKILEYLDDNAVEIQDNDILRVATIAANNDEYLGELIQEAINKVGRDGVITVEESKNHKTELVTRDGFRIDEGYLSHLMANGEDGKCTFNDPLVFMSNISFRKFQDLLPMLEISSAQNRPLLILCKGIEGNALDNLVMNILQKTVQVCAILAPNFGDAQLDELSDISSLLGGVVYTDESKDDPKLVSIDEFGTCDRVIIGKEYSTIIGGTGDVSDKISTLRKLADDMTGYDKARIKSRIAKLTGGVATIRIGAGSQLEMREKKERLDDALNATKCALSEGIVTGGGFSLLQSRYALGNSLGEKIVAKALSAPIKTLVDNSGGEYDENKLTVQLGAFDAIDCVYKPLDQYNVYDPVLVTKNSFVASMSIASLFLTTDVAVLLEE